MSPNGMMERNVAHLRQCVPPIEVLQDYDMTPLFHQDFITLVEGIRFPKLVTQRGKGTLRSTLNPKVRFVGRTAPNSTTIFISVEKQACLHFELVPGV